VLATHLKESHNIQVSPKPAGSSTQSVGTSGATGAPNQGQPPRNKRGGNKRNGRKSTTNVQQNNGVTSGNGGNNNGGGAGNAPTPNDTKGSAGGNVQTIGRTISIGDKPVKVDEINRKLALGHDFVYLNGMSFARNWLAKQISNTSIQSLVSKFKAPAEGKGRRNGGQRAGTPQ